MPTPLTADQRHVLSLYRATGHRDFPTRHGDKLLAARMRTTLAGSDNRAVAAWLRTHPHR